MLHSRALAYSARSPVSVSGMVIMILVISWNFFSQISNPMKRLRLSREIRHLKSTHQVGLSSFSKRPFYSPRSILSVENLELTATMILHSLSLLMSAFLLLISPKLIT